MTEPAAILMSDMDRGVSVLRLLLLIAAAINILAATVLYRRIFEPMYRRWWSGVRRLGAQVPPVLEDERVQRGWGVVSAGVLLWIWWVMHSC